MERYLGAKTDPIDARKLAVLLRVTLFPGIGWARVACHRAALAGAPHPDRATAHAARRDHRGD